jgi:hypothetical protein
LNSDDVLISLDGLIPSEAVFQAERVILRRHFGGARARSLTPLAKSAG